MTCIEMAIEYINYGDNGKVARDKINGIFQEVEDNIPSIWNNWNWYLWPTDTDVPATWPQGPRWPKWDTGDAWTDVMSQQEYEQTPWTESDDKVYMIRA